MDITEVIVELWNDPAWGKIIIAAGAAIASFIITRVADVAKIKSEQNIGFRTDIGKNISKAMIAMREVVYELSVFEVYNIESRLEKGETIDIMGNPGIYPAVMTDRETLFAFVSELQKLNKESASFLDRRLSAHLWIIDRYLFTLAQFVAQRELGDDLPLVGAFVILDLNKWQRETDRLIVKRMNKVRCKIQVKSGHLWEFEKRRAEKKYWTESLLYKVINNPESEEAKEVEALLMGVHEGTRV